MDEPIEPSRRLREKSARPVSDEQGSESALHSSENGFSLGLVACCELEEELEKGVEEGLEEMLDITMGIQKCGDVNVLREHYTIATVSSAHPRGEF